MFLQCHWRARYETDPSLHSLRAPSILVLFQPQGQESQTPGSDLESEWKKKGRYLNRREIRAGLGQEEQEAVLRTEKDTELTRNESQHPLIAMYGIFNGLVPGPKQLCPSIKHAPLCCSYYSSCFSYSHKSLVCPEATENSREIKIWLFWLEKIHIYKFRELSTCTAWAINEWI